MFNAFCIVDSVLFSHGRAWGVELFNGAPSSDGGRPASREQAGPSDERSANCPRLSALCTVTHARHEPLGMIGPRIGTGARRQSWRLPGRWCRESTRARQGSRAHLSLASGSAKTAIPLAIAAGSELVWRAGPWRKPARHRLAKKPGCGCRLAARSRSADAHPLPFGPARRRSVRRSSDRRA